VFFTGGEPQVKNTLIQKIYLKQSIACTVIFAGLKEHLRSCPCLNIDSIKQGDSHLDFVGTFKIIIAFYWSESRLFLGVVGFCLMADSAHNVDLMTLLVESISHRLTINVQGLVVLQ